MLEPSDELLQKVSRLVRSGASVKIAMAAYGISNVVLMIWLKRAQEDLMYKMFFEDVARSQALAVAKAERNVFKAKPEVWLTKGPGRVAEWASESIDVNLISQNTSAHNATNNVNAPLDYSKLSEQELMALNATITKLLPSGSQEDTD